MVDSFDKSTKPVFKDEKDPSYIKFGTMKSVAGSSHSPGKSHTIQLRGLCDMLTLISCSRSQVASFFRPALESIFEVIKRQREGSPSLSVGRYNLFPSRSLMFVRLLVDRLCSLSADLQLALGSPHR